MRALSRLSRLVVRASFLAATLCVSAPALAEDIDEGTKKVARDLANEGQKEGAEGHWDKAEELYSRASTLYPKAPTLVLYLARAQAKQGKWAAAVANFERIDGEWGNDEKTLSQAFRDSLELARKEVIEARTHLAFVTIFVDGSKTPTVLLDNVKVPVAALSAKRSIDAGTHTIAVTADGMKPAEVTFTARERDVVEKRIALEPEATAPPGPLATNVGVKGNADAASDGPSRAPMYIAFGLGGAGLVLGGITGGIALGKHSTLADKCPTGTCTDQYRSDVNSYKTMGTLSTVGFIVGGVGVAAGIVLLVISPKKEAPKAASVSPFLGPGSFGASGQF